LERWAPDTSARREAVENNGKYVKREIMAAQGTVENMLFVPNAGLIGPNGFEEWTLRYIV
jgi:hypothetical protein